MARTLFTNELVFRLEAAKAAYTEAKLCAGCTLVASQTRPSSGSERNLTRAGFQIAYTKLLYAPREPGASP